ncbi:MAG: DUF1292 domain-containing protein [Acetanaerobacterium sp.]
MAEEMDFGPNVLSLTDEDGNEHEFEILDELDLDEKHYVALIPASEEALEDEEEEGQLIVLKSEEENGEEYLAYIEDEEEFGRVAGMFVERLSEEYDFED